MGQQQTCEVKYEVKYDANDLEEIAQRNNEELLRQKSIQEQDKKERDQEQTEREYKGLVYKFNKACAETLDKDKVNIFVDKEYTTKNGLECLNDAVGAKRFVYDSEKEVAIRVEHEEGNYEVDRLQITYKTKKT